jgi:hypothetical protein
MACIRLAQGGNKISSSIKSMKCLVSASEGLCSTESVTPLGTLRRGWDKYTSPIVLLTKGL